MKLKNDQKVFTQVTASGMRKIWLNWDRTILPEDPNFTFTVFDNSDAELVGQQIMARHVKRR